MRNISCIFTPATMHGGIAKWPKASVCKTDIRGFKSHSRLKTHCNGKSHAVRFFS